MSLHDPARRTFASDNYAGVHPEVLAALADADGGHQTSYGDDAYTARLTEVLGEHFGREVRCSRCSTGPGRTSWRSPMLPAWGAAVCAATAHVHTDEGGAPEKVGGRQAAPRADPRRPAHPRAARHGGVGLRVRAPRPTAGGHDDPDHRARHLLPARADRRRRAGRPRPRHARAPGRRADRQRRRDARPAAARLHLRRRGRRGLARRDQERRHGCRGGRGAEPRRRRGPALPAQDPDAAGLEDALRLRPAPRAVRGRPVAALGAARQRDGAAPRRRRARRCLASRSSDRSSPTRCSRSCRGRRRPGPRAVLVLRLGRGQPARSAGCAPSTRRPQDVDAFVARSPARCAADQTISARRQQPGVHQAEHELVAVGADATTGASPGSPPAAAGGCRARAPARPG